MEAICKNCQTQHADSYKYCPECSQKTALHRLSFHDVAHEAVHYFTHADKGLFQLIRDLITKRGLVAYEYINGKRKKYFPPLSFFLLIAAVFVFVATTGEQKQTKSVLEAHPEVNRISDPVEKQQMVALYERKVKVSHFTTKYSNLMAMSSLPLTALVFFVFYRRKGYNYVEHLVAGMYMVGFAILVYAGIILPLSFAFHFEGNPAILAFFLVQLIYFAVFYYAFMKQNTKLQWLKAFGASLLNLILWVMISGSLVKFYITSGFGGFLE